MAAGGGTLVRARAQELVRGEGELGFAAASVFMWTVRCLRVCVCVCARARLCVHYLSVRLALSVSVCLSVYPSVSLSRTHTRKGHLIACS